MTLRDLSDNLGLIIREIFQSWRFDPARTRIACVTMDADADSSQAVNWLTKPLLQQLGYGAATLLNSVRKIGDKAEGYDNTVLIDEFSGTGKTILNRINHTKKAIDARMRTLGIANSHNVSVALVCAMKDAADAIKPECYRFYSSTVLRKGISAHSSGFRLLVEKECMLGIESELGDYPKKKVYSFGYGGAEALYAVQGCNIPNSVFPIFWWPRLNDGSTRQTMFSRKEDGIE